MSTVAKQLFMKDLTEQLESVLTVKTMADVMEAVKEVFSQYKIERCEEEQGQEEFEDILNSFLGAKRVEGRSEKTLARYEYIIGKFRERDSTPIRKITVNNLREYFSNEMKRGISDSTLKGTREIFSSFFGWAYREGLIPSNPSGNLNTIKCRKEVRLPYSDVDIERLKEACTTTRDKAIIAFLISTGCRIGEVCGLNRRDIDFQNLECTVLGKGNKERTVYLDSVAAMQLQKYPGERKDNATALFVGKGSERLHPGGVRKRLNEIGERAGVENVHPHRFRRTLATNLINHGMPIQEVANILGHEKIDTTMTYVYIDKQNVKNSYRKYS